MPNFEIIFTMLGTIIGILFTGILMIINKLEQIKIAIEKKG